MFVLLIQGNFLTFLAKINHVGKSAKTLYCNISVYILHTVLHTFYLVMIMRIVKQSSPLLLVDHFLFSCNLSLGYVTTVNSLASDHPWCTTKGSRVGVVVRAFVFHQFVPGSIPTLGVISGLSLLVLYSAPTGFSPGPLVFPSPQKPTFD